MNTPDSQNIQPTQETPNAPLANRVRAADERHGDGHGEADGLRQRWGDGGGAEAQRGE